MDWWRDWQWSDWIKHLIMYRTFTGKVLLFGEYTVIGGSRALVIPIKNFSGKLHFNRPEPQSGPGSGTQKHVDDAILGLVFSFLFWIHVCYLDKQNFVLKLFYKTIYNIFEIILLCHGFRLFNSKHLESNSFKYCLLLILESLMYISHVSESISILPFESFV